jgi:Ca2+-binding EF-hand superfamily protein
MQTKNKKTPKQQINKNISMVFKLYDEDKDGFVELKYLGEMLRALGGCLLENEIENICEKFMKENKSDIFTIQNFEKLCQENIKNNETIDDLIKSFKYWDQENTGKISINELKQSLTTIGDVLKDYEMEYLIKESDPTNSGVIDYVKYSKELMKKL